MRVPYVQVHNVKDWEELRRWSDVLFNPISEILNGKFNFQDNFDAQSISITFPTINVDTLVPHTLNRIPSGYLVIRQSSTGVVYDGLAPWTESSIYLRSNVAMNITVLVF